MTCARGRHGKWCGLATVALTGLVAVYAGAVTIEINLEVSTPKGAGQSYLIGTRPRFEGTEEKPVTMPTLATLESLVKNSEPDPRDICRNVSKLVKYAPDTQAEDEWRSAEETLKGGRGDCEDFAECIAATCQAKGLSAKLYILRSHVNEQSHAVTIGEDNGAMWMSSNSKHQAVASLSDAKDKVCKEMGWWYDDVTISDAGPTVRTATGTPTKHW